MVGLQSDPLLSEYSSKRQHGFPHVAASLIVQDKNRPILWIVSFYHGLDGLDGVEPLEPFEPLEPLEPLSGP